MWNLTGDMTLISGCICLYTCITCVMATPPPLYCTPPPFPSNPFTCKLSPTSLHSLSLYTPLPPSFPSLHYIPYHLPLCCSLSPLLSPTSPLHPYTYPLPPPHPVLFTLVSEPLELGCLLYGTLALIFTGWRYPTDGGNTRGA